MTPNCEARHASTVAPQSLLLMNDTFILEQSVALARRLEQEAPGSHLGRIQKAWQLVFGSSPSSQETARALIFLTESNQDWAAWCQALLASSGFLYVE